MNYNVEIKEPTGAVVFKGKIDLTPYGLLALKELLLYGYFDQCPDPARRDILRALSEGRLKPTRENW